jgi:putative ABC transport system permease protein
MGLYLAFKELWRNRGRFILFSLVIALITVLVLFVAALGEGLGAGNREFIEKLNADLIVFERKADLLVGASQIGQTKLNSIRRVEGVRAAAPIVFSNVTVNTGDGKVLKVALIGVEPGQPGEPPAYAGQALTGRNAREAVLDRNVAIRTGLRPGDEFIVKATQGTEEKKFRLKVAGISDGRQYALQQAVFVPYLTFDRIRPRPTEYTGESPELIGNVVAVQVVNPGDVDAVRQRIERAVDSTQVVDRVTAYTAAPGYTAQQSTLNTQRYFALLIGVLVIGGFFQIQTLQKVPQIGVLKAIGAPNGAVAVAAITQIVAITVLGVSIGTAGVLALSLSFPPTIPIVFARDAVLAAVASLLLIGPIGGAVSIRYSLRIEPLTALGLSA